MKSLIACISIFLVLPAWGQFDSAMQLQWKIRANEVLIYKTVMQEIDTAKAPIGSEEATDRDRKRNKKQQREEDYEVLQKILKGASAIPLITKLVRKNEEVINIEMSVDRTGSDTTSKNNETSDFLEMAEKMNGGVMLRGAIFENGEIASFYVKSDQKNLIALFFELPSKPVKPGETWSIDVNFISMDQNFTCDSSYRHNKVTLVEVKEVAGEKIAVLEYDLKEFVSGNFGNAIFSPADGKKAVIDFRFNAVAEFSLDRGQWDSYNGLMTLSSTLSMIPASVKQVALIKVDSK